MGSVLRYSLVPVDPHFAPEPDELTELVEMLREDGWIPDEEHFDVEVPEIGIAPFKHETHDHGIGGFCKQSPEGLGQAWDANYWRETAMGPGHLCLNFTWLVPLWGPEKSYPWAAMEEDIVPLQLPTGHALELWANEYETFSYDLKFAVSDGPLFCGLWLDCKCGASLSDQHPTWGLAEAICQSCGKPYKVRNLKSRGKSIEEAKAGYRFAVQLDVMPAFVVLDPLRQGLEPPPKGFSKPFVSSIARFFNKSFVSYMDIV